MASACGVLVHSVALNSLWKYEENTSTLHENLFFTSDSRLFDRTSFVVNINKQLITYIAQYQILGIVQSAVYFLQTCSTQFLWKASSQAAINARRPFICYSTLSLAIYAFV